MDNTNKLTHISLCTGYGGIDIGLSRALRAVRSVAYVEIEAFPIINLVEKIEAGLMDPAPIFTDLKKFPWGLYRGKVDILSGGFPCQPFSAAGRRAGDEDPRHLWPFIVKGIRELGRPSLVFFENVEGIISSKLKGDSWRDREGTPVLLHVLRELERLGYKATAGIFSAAEVGAPHQRKRVFILGVRNDLEQSGFDLVNSFISQESLVNSDNARSVSSEDGDNTDRPTILERQEDFSQFEPDRLCDVVSTYPRERGAKQYEWEPPRIMPAQPSMGRDVDGPSCWLDYAELSETCDSRIDELRMLGNGVVPDTASRAFKTLFARLA